MSNLKFADTHNMVTFLEKPTKSVGFEEIVYFLNAQPVRYALTINPIIYTSCIKQFWATAKAKTVNGEVQLHALVDGKKVILTESTVRRYLHLEDAKGFDCLPTAAIFEQLTLMGYEKLSHKLTFYKSSGPIEPVVDKDVYKERDDSLVRVTTTASSLPADSRRGPRCQETMSGTIAQTRSENVSKLSNDPLLAKEKKGGSRTHKLKRLYKDGRSARVGSSDKASLDDQEDASKQGRKINDIDKDAEITLVDETQGRYGDDLMFDTGIFDDERVSVRQDMAEKKVSTTDPVTTAGEEITTAGIEVSIASTIRVSDAPTTTTTTAVITKVEITLAQALAKLKTAKPKVKGIVFKELVESTTTTRTPIPSKD
ncbi:hypothetical protein Tco_1158778 [Tanacetum coccineum]